MKTFNTKHAAALLLTLTLGLGTAKLLNASSSPTQQATPGSASGSQAEVHEEAAPALPQRAWKEGECVVYDIDTTRGMSIRNKEQADQVLSYHVLGSLRLTVMGKDANEARIRVDLLPKRVEVMPATEKDAKSFLSATFFLRMGLMGNVKNFYFPKEVPAEARTLLQGIVDSFQMVTPPSPALTWAGVEADVSGQFNATYRALDASTIEKAKTHYVSTRSPGGFLPLQKGTKYAVRSKATFGLDTSGWPKSLVEDESLTVSVQSTMVFGTIKTTAKLTGVESHPEWVGPLAVDLESDTVGEAAVRDMSIKQADKNLVGGRSFADIKTDLNADDKRARNQAQARMAALFRVSPDETKKAVDEILHGKGDTNAQKRMIGALGSAGTPEAQHELARLLDMEEAGEKRVNAAIALSLTKNATPETAAALQKASSSKDTDVANTAILASGNVVRTMNAEQSGDTTDAVQMLIDGLTNANTDAQRVIYLEALGNTGDVRTLAAVTPYLAHTTVALRAAATGALKFMVGSAVDLLIITALSDSEFSVRRAAVSTIAFRPIGGVLPAVDALLKSEPEQVIRMDILKALNVKIKEDHTVIDSVMWAMDNDPSQAVQAYAKQVVDGAKLDEE